MRFSSLKLRVSSSLMSDAAQSGAAKAERKRDVKLDRSFGSVTAAGGLLRYPDCAHLYGLVNVCPSASSLENCCFSAESEQSGTASVLVLVLRSKMICTESCSCSVFSFPSLAQPPPLIPTKRSESL